MARTRVESHQRLLERIEDPAQRARLSKVLQLCMGSLGALARLDAAIFERRQQSQDGRALLEALTEAEGSDREREELVAQLRSLAEIVWGPADALSEVIRALFARFAGDDEEDDLDFDAAFAEGAPDMTRSREGDIDDALDVLSDESKIHPATDQEVAQALVPLAYALEGQIQNSKRRLEAAISEGRLRQALHDIDESRRETTEAIFAVVESVFRVHKLHPARASILPGFLSDLDQALQIRREVAILHRYVRAQNELVQDTSADEGERQFALIAVRGRMSELVREEVFRHMRASDRFELLAFSRKLGEEDLASGARLTLEGLTKYLESLGAVNQREVIVRHDQAVMATTRTHIEAARPLFELSPDAAREVVESAFAEAHKLSGWREPLDELLEAWTIRPAHDRGEQELRGLLDQLSGLLPVT